MDQRRLFLFLTLCFLLMIAFGPKAKPPEQPVDEKPAEQVESNAEEAVPDTSVADSIASDEPLADRNDDNIALSPEADIELEYVTLGSVNPESPYRMGVTLTNHGAAVRRVELSSPRFRDLQDRGGYLGHMELALDDRGGLRIQSLVAGTPAAEAGLEIGDRLVSLRQKDQLVPLSSVKQLLDHLVTVKPGKKLSLQVSQNEQPPVALEVTLGRRPLEVIRPEAENVFMRTGKLPAGVKSPPSFQLTLEQIGANEIAEDAEEIANVALRNTNWEISDRTDTSVTFRRRLPQYGLEVQKHYRLEPVPQEEQQNQNYPGYSLTLDVELRNLSQKDFPVRYQLDGPNGLPIEGWWYSNKVGRTWSAVGIRDVVARHEGNDTVQFGPTEISTEGVETMQGPPLAFAGVDAQYFSAVLLPKKPNLETLWIDEVRSISLSPKPKARSSEGRFANVTCRLISHELDLKANESLRHSYDVFVGPKRPDLLANYHASDSPRYGLSDLMYYGWFSTVSKLMLGILHFFYGIIGNYGLAIIMLTVLVRGCMFPISRKQAQSMAKMQELRPEMDKLKEKYKQDMQKQSQAMQELYRKHNINPLAGCLPLFIQMPIFLGLYRALMVDVELRQAPLLGDAIRWCSNLAAPDMFLDWSSFMPNSVNSGEAFLVGLGPYLNILPLATAGLFLLQQKMFMPEPANEQAAMQQKIMKYMMLVMGLLFFKVAAGLCIYFIASSIWGIAERKMLPKPSTAAASVASAPSSTSSSSSVRSVSADTAPKRRNNKKKSKKKKR